MIQSTKLRNLQSDQDLLEIKRILANYFAGKLTAEAERIWNEKGLTNEDMDKWLKEFS